MSKNTQEKKQSNKSDKILVRITNVVSTSTYRLANNVGDEVELDPDFAKRLIEDKRAELIK